MILHLLLKHLPFHEGSPEPPDIPLKIVAV